MPDVLTEADKKKLWDEVVAEFPGDDTMQMVHYVRLLHYHQTKDLSPEEQIRFYNEAAQRRVSA
jgi:hypothetical protein